MDLRRIVLSLVLTTTFTASTVAAQCAGDCGGNGEVTIDELLLMVNVALDNMPAAQCTAGDANGDGAITVNEIVAAVNKALAGCIPDVAGTWQQDQATIFSSTCAPDIDGIVQGSIDAGDFICTYQVAQSGEHATITSTCADETDVFEGTVDATGVLTVSTTEQDTVDGCVITLAQTTSGNVTMSPTAGTHLMQFGFSAGCGFENCAIVVQARWTKVVALP